MDWQFGRACLFSGDLTQAVTELDTASDLANRRPMWQAELCFGRARAGDRSGAAAILSELTTLARSSYVSPYDLALCYAGLGEADAALNHLEQAYRERVMRIISLGDPELDGLRLEPRFTSLVERLRLPRRFQQGVRRPRREPSRRSLTADWSRSNGSCFCSTAPPQHR